MTVSVAHSMPGWLHFVLRADRAGSSWYIGSGFFFAPALAALAPWPAVRLVLWALIAVMGFWLGLLGVAMATGLALMLRAGEEISEHFWRSVLDYPTSRPQCDSGQNEGCDTRRLSERGTVDGGLVPGRRPG